MLAERKINALCFSTESDAITAEAQICVNACIPDGNGTLSWSQVYEHVDAPWYITPPRDNGWNGHTKEEILAGVAGYTEKELSIWYEQQEI